MGQPIPSAGGGGGGAYTLTIAAADTPGVLSARADYIGDGAAGMGDVAGDEAEINTALGIADTVQLLPGTFWVNNSIQLGDNQTLIGSGAGTLIKIRNGINKDLNVITNSGGVSGNQRVTVRNLALDGNYSNWVSGNQHGIHFIEVATSNLLLGGMIDGVYSYGDFCGCHIWLEDCYNTVVTKNILTNLPNSGTSGRGIYVDACYHCTIGDNVVTDQDDVTGIYVYNGSWNAVTGNTISNIVNDSCISCSGTHCTITGNTCYNYGYYGVRITGSHNTVANNSLCGDPADDSAGIDIYCVGAAKGYNIISGNNICLNGGEGIKIEGSSIHNTIVGNSIIANSQKVNGGAANVLLTAVSTYYPGYNLIEGNTIKAGGEANKPDYGIEIAIAGANENYIVDNDLYEMGFTAAPLRDLGTCTIVRGNRGFEITDERDLHDVKNTSGGGLVAGDVVVHKAVAAGNEVTTTANQGDDMVFGMVAEAIADNTLGLVLKRGKTIALKVNGTAAIAIGDLLGTYTTAKISMKAAAGDMAFAIALEAYANADSSGVIDALLISPRKV